MQSARHRLVRQIAAEPLPFKSAIQVYFWCCSVRHTDRSQAARLAKTSPIVATELEAHLHRRSVLSMIGLRAGRRCLSTATPRTVKSLLFPASPLDEGHVCSVNGWVRSVRTQKHVAFVALGDGTTLKPLQVVLQPAQADG
jgi:hypothetical protein